MLGVIRRKIDASAVSPTRRRTKREPGMKAQHETQRREALAAEEGWENGEKKREIVKSVLVVVIIVALAAGLVYFLAIRQHDRDAARSRVQVKVTQKAQSAGRLATAQELQVRAAGQLETAADALYKSTRNVYTYQAKCAELGKTWAVCSALAPGLANFSATTATFDTDHFGLTDRTASALTTQFAHLSIETVEASSAAEGHELWTKMVTAYAGLIKRCGQLGQR